ncbi:MAG TPA: cysteine dioxygenase family protein [Flavobacteriales bacterium]|nr:cysteine dioxygenase family protein [Flavobacteriales bacterium]
MALPPDNNPSTGLITSIEELIRTIDREPNAAGYTDALLRFSMAPEDLAPLGQWNSRHYTRQCLHRTPQHELLLICYEPGQGTSIHDYDSQTAWIKPLVGTVQEERFKIAPDGGVTRQGRRQLVPGQVAYMATKNCIHRHTNTGAGRAITLNLYARPIRRWRVYDERTGRASLSGAGQAAGQSNV